MAKVLCVLFLLILVGCQQKQPVQNPWQEIAGRDLGHSLIIRHPVYRARVPYHWKRVDPLPSVSNADTTKPLVEFWIDDQVSVNVHNFPSDSLEERIPPAAQVARWRKQLVGLNPKEAVVKPISRAGFAGLFFEGQGHDVLVMAWSLQLDAEHYRVLLKGENRENGDFLKQMRADVTIKVVGPPDVVESYQDELMDFAGSFELIQEIPDQRYLTRKFTG